MTLINEIKNCIEKQLKCCLGGEKIIICPFGDIGLQVKSILNNCYGIQERYIIDNYLCKFNSEIKNVSFLKTIDTSSYSVILATKDYSIYDTLKKDVAKYVHSKNIVELPSMMKKETIKKELEKEKKKYTIVGKYSYGPLCNHRLVESVGSFSGIGPGCDVVQNHAMNYITVHPFIFSGGDNDLVSLFKYDERKEADWYFPGVRPKGKIEKCSRIKIGNDVWLGKNVIITNGANIGNGVIVGAGAVITKDIPDYAVAVGVPARIIRYRYTEEQICALNQIAWWDWEEEQIRRRYNDLYLPIDEFINKYLPKVEEK